MNLNINKKKISQSIIEKEITSLNFQAIQTCWKTNLETKKVNDIHKNTSFQDLLKKKINPIDHLQKKQTLKKLSKTTFIGNFNNNQQHTPMKELENIKLSNKIIGYTKAFSFDTNLEITNFLKQKNNSKHNDFWFIQLKNFFLKKPNDNLKIWALKKTDIYNSINITNLTHFSLFSINSKINKK